MDGTSLIPLIVKNKKWNIPYSSTVILGWLCHLKPEPMQQWFAKQVLVLVWCSWYFGLGSSWLCMPTLASKNDRSSDHWFGIQSFVSSPVYKSEHTTQATVFKNGCSSFSWSWSRLPWPDVNSSLFSTSKVSVVLWNQTSWLWASSLANEMQRTGSRVGAAPKKSLNRLDREKGNDVTFI